MATAVGNVQHELEDIKRKITDTIGGADADQKVAVDKVTELQTQLDTLTIQVNRAKQQEDNAAQMKSLIDGITNVLPKAPRDDKLPVTERSATMQNLVDSIAEQKGHVLNDTDGVTQAQTDEYAVILNKDFRLLETGKYTAPIQVRVQDSNLPKFTGLAGDGKVLESFQVDLENLFTAQNRSVDYDKAKVLSMFLSDRAQLEYDTYSKYVQKSYFLSMEKLRKLFGRDSRPILDRYAGVTMSQGPHETVASYSQRMLAAFRDAGEVSHAMQILTYMRGLKKQIAAELTKFNCATMTELERQATRIEKALSVEQEREKTPFRSKSANEPRPPTPIKAAQVTAIMEDIREIRAIQRYQDGYVPRSRMERTQYNRDNYQGHAADRYDRSRSRDYSRNYTPQHNPRPRSQSREERERYRSSSRNRDQRDNPRSEHSQASKERYGDSYAHTTQARERHGDTRPGRRDDRSASRSRDDRPGYRKDDYRRDRSSSRDRDYKYESRRRGDDRRGDERRRDGGDTRRDQRRFPRQVNSVQRDEGESAESCDERGEYTD